MSDAPQPLPTSFPGLQEIRPVKSYNAWADYVEYVPPSKTKKLKPGQQIDNPPWPEKVGEWVIQKLTDRTYWMISDAFCITVYVGDESVLVIDAPQLASVEGFLGAIGEVTDLEVSTLVYSHPHIDHIGLAERLNNRYKEKGKALRIIGSERAVREMKRYKMPVPQPTEVLPDGRRTFDFEGRTFKFVTPADWAHCGADSYVITPDKVIMFVDFVYPQRLPMAKFSGVENMNGYVEFLRYVAGEQWDFACYGHDNVGHKKDVLMTLDYIKDLYTTFFNFARMAWNPKAFEGSKDHVGVFIRNTFDGVSGMVAAAMKAKWGKFPHYEIARDHAVEVMWDGFLNYDFLLHPEIKPDFTPILAPDYGKAKFKSELTSITGVSPDFPYESKYIEVLGSKMHYIEAGEGDPILFLHGNPTSSYLWRNVIPHLSGQGRCIAPDMMGFGKSDKPDIEYRVFDQIKYIEAFIEALDLKNITLVMHDWGSAIGLNYAMAHQDNVEALAMMEAHLRPIPTWQDFAADPQMIEGFKAFRTPGLGEQLVIEQNMFVEQVLPGAIKRFLTEEEFDAYQAPFAKAEDRKPLLQLPRDIPVEGEPADTFEMFSNYSRKMTKSQIPKLLLYFDGGIIVKEAELEFAKNNFPNLTTVKVKDSIHFVQEDDPDGIGKAIADWRSTIA